MREIGSAANPTAHIETTEKNAVRCNQAFVGTLREKSSHDAPQSR